MSSHQLLVLLWVALFGQFFIYLVHFNFLMFFAGLQRWLKHSRSAWISRFRPHIFWPNLYQPDYIAPVVGYLTSKGLCFIVLLSETVHIGILDRHWDFGRFVWYFGWLGCPDAVAAFGRPWLPHRQTLHNRRCFCKVEWHNHLWYVVLHSSNFDDPTSLILVLTTRWWSRFAPCVDTRSHSTGTLSPSSGDTSNWHIIVRWQLW